MKIQNTNLQLNNQKQNPIGKNSQEINFTSGVALAQFLNFLETNQAWGATAVDLGCMGIPRTTVDFTRSPEAGVETMRREFSSTANDAMLGLYGLGAAFALSYAFNKQYGVKFHRMFVSDERLEILGQLRDECGDIRLKKNLKKYYYKAFENLKGFNPDNPNCDSTGYVGIDKKTIEKAVSQLMQNTETDSKKVGGHVRALIADATGSEMKFKLEYNNIESVSSLNDAIDNIRKIASAFREDKVAETFKKGQFLDNALIKVLKIFKKDKIAETLKENRILDNEFIKVFKKLNGKTTVLGLAMAMAVGLSLQPLNMYLTKKKTGKTGFVGVEGKEPDDSFRFKLLKLGVAVLGAYGVIKSIGKFREIPGKIQFKGLIPTLDQFKMVYGATILSRLLSSRDKHELREVSIKDSLGFVNWLILGGFVSKLVAMGLDKTDKFKNDKFIRYKGTGGFKRLLESNIVSYEEILRVAFKKAGISTIKADGTAMKVREMLKFASKSKSEHLIKAMKKVKYRGLIQFAGYLWSGLALGIGIPKLNIAITKAVRKKHKLKHQHEHEHKQEAEKMKTAA